MKNTARDPRSANTIRRWLLLAIAAVGSVLVLGLGGAYWASQRAPAFYREALSASAAETSQHGDEFERAALAVHNAAQHAGRWEVALSADEINAWLATELPAKFPRLLPAGVTDPRVAIDGDMLRVAVHYHRGGVDTVLSLGGEAYLTAQTNELAIRLDHARAGLVPIPLGRVIQAINERSERADVNLRWTEVKGSPLVLIRLPLDADNDDRRVVVDRLDTRPGQVLLAGHTETPLSPHSPAPAPTAAGQSEKATRQR